MEKIMKIWISYFYQVRNFTPNMIPFSTAMSDPKWFHKFESQSKVFVDNNGIINGLRLPELVYPSYCYDKDEPCSKDCPKKSIVELKSKIFKGDFGCKFMNTYYNYLWNNVDFDKLMEKLEQVASKFTELNDPQDDVEIVLLVHEPPSCPCAERPVLIKWFADLGYELEEWNPYE